jgi:hypothetical protein
VVSVCRRERPPATVPDPSAPGSGGRGRSAATAGGGVPGRVGAGGVSRPRVVEGRPRPVTTCRVPVGDWSAAVVANGRRRRFAAGRRWGAGCRDRSAMGRAGAWSFGIGAGGGVVVRHWGGRGRGRSALGRAGCRDRAGWSGGPRPVTTCRVPSVHWSPSVVANGRRRRFATGRRWGAGCRDRSAMGRAGCVAGRRWGAGGREHAGWRRAVLRQVTTRRMPRDHWSPSVVSKGRRRRFVTGRRWAAGCRDRSAVGCAVS